MGNPQEDTNRRNFFRYEVLLRFQWQPVSEEKYQQVLEEFERTGCVLGCDDDKYQNLVSVLEEYAKIDPPPELANLIHQTKRCLLNHFGLKPNQWNNSYWINPGLVNLSSGGIAYYTSEDHLRAEQKLAFRFEFSDQRTISTIYGRVVRVIQEDQRNLISCRFDPIDANTKDLIYRFILNFQQRQLRQKAEAAFESKQARRSPSIQESPIEEGMEAYQNPSGTWHKRYIRLDVSMPVVWKIVSEFEYTQASNIFNKCRIVPEVPNLSRGAGVDYNLDFESSLYVLINLSPMSRVLLLELWDMLDELASKVSPNKKNLFNDLKTSLISSSQQLSRLSKVSAIQVRILAHCRNLFNILFDKYVKDRAKLRFLLKEEIRKAKATMLALRNADSTQAGILDKLFYSIVDTVHTILTDGLIATLGHHEETFNISASGVMLRIPKQKVLHKYVSLHIGTPATPIEWILSYGEIVASYDVVPPTPPSRVSPRKNQDQPGHTVLRVKFTLLNDNDRKIIFQYVNQKILEAKRKEKATIPLQKPE